MKVQIGTILYRDESGEPTDDIPIYDDLPDDTAEKAVLDEIARIVAREYHRIKREQYIDVGASRKKPGARMIRLIEPDTNGQLGGLFYGYPNYERETYSLYPADEETRRFYSKRIVAMLLVARSGK